jgi:hypothetical protein
LRKTVWMARLVVLISITVAVEMVGLPQPLTGPFINFMLILTTLLISTLAGVAVSFITPLLAVVRGQLPAPLAPMVPFIIFANVLFVVIFGLVFQKKETGDFILWRSGAAVALAALCKFALLYASARFVLPLLLGKKLPAALVSVMAFPQLLTAVIGATLALLFFRLLRRTLY